MKTVARTALALLLSATLTPLVHAADLTPGLWEFTSRKFSVGGSPDLSGYLGMMRDQLRLLPPDTRRLLEEKMQQHGVTMDADGRVRSCLSAEQIDRDQLFSGRVEGHCSFSQISKTANRMRGHIRCSQPQGNGDFDLLIHDPKHFSTRVSIRSAQGELQTETEARWLSAHCPPPAASAR